MEGCKPGQIGHMLPDETPISIGVTRAGGGLGRLLVYFAGDLREMHLVDLREFKIITEKVNP